MLVSQNFSGEQKHATHSIARRLIRRPQRHGLSSGNGQAAQRPRRSVAACPQLAFAGDRELIATYVFSLNDCYFCQTVHGAIAAACLNDNYDLVKRVKADFRATEISSKLKFLLVIAAKVRRDGKHVTSANVDAAREQWAIDTEIYDTVLIAAALCMYNRYVDGLDTWQPHEEALYLERGKRLRAKAMST